MKLEPKAIVHYRLSLLINKSKAFRKEVNDYNNELKKCIKNGFIPHDLFNKAIQKINKEFSVGILNNEEEIALDAIRKYLETNVDQKIAFNYKNDEIIFTIKAPITKKEFEEQWENHVRKMQLNFVEGYKDKDIVKYNKNIKRAQLKKLGTHKKRKGYKQRYLELDKKRWETQLSPSERKEFSELSKVLTNMDVFKYPSGISNIDEDLLILRLYNKYHCDSKKANEEYKKIKLALYLSNRDGKNYKFLKKDDFSELVSKYISEDEMKKRKVNNTEKLIRAKDFDSRLRAVKEVYMI